MKAVGKASADDVGSARCRGTHIWAAADAPSPQKRESASNEPRRAPALRPVRARTPLTTTAIQKHLDDFGLHEEFGTYVPRPRPFSTPWRNG